MTFNRTIQMFELEEKMNKFLPSQAAFMRSNAMFKVLSGGFASGKSRVACLHGVLLSAMYPGNEGLVGRYHSKQLDDSTIPSFFEVLPESWIKTHGWNKQSKTLHLKNGSKVYFRHIHDAQAKSPTKSRNVGANLGWFFLDQMEEMDIEHFNGMMGRLRNPRAKTRFGLGAANPNGRDWIQKMFFPDGRSLTPDEMFRVYPQGDLLGILVNSEENRKSRGGFVDDSFFDVQLKTLPAYWIARYMHGSLEDFTGKIYPGFNKDSVHVIRPFSIPKHWECVVGIDVGGDCPWAVDPHYVDEYGNLIIADGFHKATGRTGEVAQWIKSNIPWNDNRTTFIIDPENKIAMVELADLGIHCRIATKAVLPGILRTAGYFHVQPGAFLPQWYLETQPTEQVEKFKRLGVPRIFVFDTNKVWIDDHDGYVWDEKHKNEPKKTATERRDSCDGTRYVCLSRPQASSLKSVDKYADLRRQDPVSAREWESLDRKLASFDRLREGQLGIQEAFGDDTYDFNESDAVLTRSVGYDWDA